jgi:nicotinamidase-related amidase
MGWRQDVFVGRSRNEGAGKRMRRDKTKAILSTIATLTSVALMLVYWLAPADDDSHRLHILLIDCIPDAVVVLIAMPIVYWLLYRRGLTNMGDCPLFSPGNQAPAANPQPHPYCSVPTHGPEKADNPPESKDELVQQHDVLVVLDFVCDPDADSPDAQSVVAAVNAAIRAAEARDMLVVFAGKLHQQKDRTLPDAGGRLTRELYRPAGCMILELDLCMRSGGGSVWDNQALELLLLNPRVRTVYVVGGVLEVSVRGLCHDILRHGKRTVALEAAIPNASGERDTTEKVWQELVAEGLVRTDQLPVRDDESGVQ